MANNQNNNQNNNNNTNNQNNPIAKRARALANGTTVRCQYWVTIVGFLRRPLEPIFTMEQRVQSVTRETQVQINRINLIPFTLRGLNPDGTVSTGVATSWFTDNGALPAQTFPEATDFNFWGRLNIFLQGLVQADEAGWSCNVTISPTVATNEYHIQRYLEERVYSPLQEFLNKLLALGLEQNNARQVTAVVYKSELPVDWPANNNNVSHHRDGVFYLTTHPCDPFDPISQQNSTGLHVHQRTAFTRVSDWVISPYMTLAVIEHKGVNAFSAPPVIGQVGATGPPGQSFTDRQRKRALTQMRAAVATCNARYAFSTDGHTTTAFDFGPVDPAPQAIAQGRPIPVDCLLFDPFIKGSGNRVPCPGHTVTPRIYDNVAENFQGALALCMIQVTEQSPMESRSLYF